MAGFTDFMSQRKKPNLASGTTEPLDTGEGTRPRLTFNQFMQQKNKQPQLSQETVKDVTAQPVGRPQGTQEAPQVAPQEPTQEEPSMWDTVKDVAGTALTAAVSPSAFIGQYTQEHPEEAMEFATTEGMPTAGAAAALALAPETMGGSVLAAMAYTAGMSAIGAFTGEALEQTAKLEGVMPLGKEETAPKDGWDVMERSAIRGGQEAAWSMIPDMLVRGVPASWRKLLMTGGKGAVDELGNTVDAGKVELTNLMRDYAQKNGLEEGQVLLASDVAEVPLLNMAEAISSNSYITGSKIGAIRGAQEEAIKEKIGETVGQYMEPAKGYVQSTTDEAIRRYIEPNMESMNDFAVAGLIRVGFTKAQEAQKSVARSMYRTIGDSMEVTTMRPVYKEIELPLIGPDGRPLTTMVNTTEEVPAFPVNLRGVKEIAEKRADETLGNMDSSVAEMLGFPNETDFTKASNKLIEWNAITRNLEKSIAAGSAAEQAPVKLMHYRNASKALEKALNDTVENAHAAGISAPDGRSLRDLKQEADGIWKEQAEDFQNSYILNILKQTKPKSGAPEKLGQMFMKNEMAAKNIMKVLDDAKGSLQGEALEQVVQAENSIKGSIVQEVFMPFDRTNGQYVAPDVRAIGGKKDVLKRIFGDEGYQELNNLAAVIEEQAGTHTSNYLGFAQRARESGMILEGLKSVTRADFGPVIRDGGATILFAMGAGRILTSPKNLRYAAMVANPRVPISTRIGLGYNLFHQFVEWKSIESDGATPNEIERGQGRLDDVDEYKTAVKQINKQ